MVFVRSTCTATVKLCGAVLDRTGITVNIHVQEALPILATNTVHVAVEQQVQESARVNQRIMGLPVRHCATVTATARATRTVNMLVCATNIFMVNIVNINAHVTKNMAPATRTTIVQLVQAIVHAIWIFGVQIVQPRVSAMTTESLTRRVNATR